MLRRRKGQFNTHIATTMQFEIIRDGKVIARSVPISNVTTDAGRNIARQVLHQTAHGAINGFQYIAVGSTDYTPAAGDTTLTGEVTTDGLARVSSTYTSEAGTGAWKLEHTFTYTGAGITIYTGGVFNAASGVTLLYAAAFSSSAVLATNDQLKVTITGTVGAA